MANFYSRGFGSSIINIAPTAIAKAMPAMNPAQNSILASPTDSIISGNRVSPGFPQGSC